MDRHLQSFREPALLNGAALALSLLLGACGGGGGGGGASGVGWVAGVYALDTDGPSASDTNPSTQEVGSASLNWQAPSQRVDGESLAMSEIAGYRIYYGTSSGHYDSVLSVDDPYTFSILVGDLPVGTYHFVMTTVDTNGIESGYSGEAVKTVQS